MESEQSMEASSSSTRPLKQKKSSDNSTTEQKTLDRISTLPDSILIHILSFLPVKYALRTSILSKQWKFLCTFVPVIDFADRLNWDGNRGFTSIVSSIDTFLILHQSPKLKKFSLQFNYLRRFDSKVNVWLRFATRKNAEVIELDCRRVDTRFITIDDDFDFDFESEYKVADSYVVPLYVLNNSSLLSLKLVKCDLLKYGELINWRSLKSLSLGKMSLSNILIGQILCGSPLLESLELCECRGFNVIDIKSKMMRKLVLDGYGYCYYSDEPTNPAALKIVAPNIKSLKILDYTRTRKILLANSCSFVDVELNFCLLLRGAFDMMGCGKCVRKLLENLRCVKYLTVGNDCLRVLALLNVRILPYFKATFECLRLSIYLTKDELAGMSRFLTIFGHGCVQLTLVMNTRSTHPFLSEVEPVPEDFESYLTALKIYSSTALQRIKTVKFVNFTDQECMIQLVLFLLKNARRLEKMIIHTRQRMTLDWKNSSEIAQRILNSPRGSKKSVVMFS